MGAREIVVALVLACALPVVVSWPLVTSLETRLPSGLEDPALQAWETAWLGHAATAQPRDLFQANHSWPLANSLAFNDAKLGYVPAGLVGDGLEAAVARYNVLFLFTFALAFFGAFLLARELGATVGGGLVAGTAFAYAPWRVAHLAHLHVLSSGGIPLALFFLLRGYRTRRAALVAAGWVTSTWQLTLGFTLGLQLVYLIAALGLVAVLLSARLRGALADRQVAAATVAGVALLAATAALQARPYLDVARDHAASERSKLEVSALSPLPQSFLAAPAQSLLWGGATEPVRATLRTQEQTLFVGVTIAALALAGAWSRRNALAVRLPLVAALSATGALALGLHVSLGRLAWLLPYNFLYELAPGWQGIRTPGRLMTLTSLGLSLLAALGADRLTCAVDQDRRGNARRSLAAAGLTALLAAAVVLEGSWRIGYAAVPRPPALSRLAEPQLHLPMFVREKEFGNDSIYLLWSVDGFPRLANSVAGFQIEAVDRLREEMLAFPSSSSVALLRERGIRVVVLHRRLAGGTVWEAVAPRSAAGLPLRVLRRADVVVYRLSPSTAPTETAAG